MNANDIFDNFMDSIEYSSNATQVSQSFELCFARYKNDSLIHFEAELSHDRFEQWRNINNLML